MTGDNKEIIQPKREILFSINFFTHEVKSLQTKLVQGTMDNPRRVTPIIKVVGVVRSQFQNDSLKVHKNKENCQSLSNFFKQEP